MQPLAPATEGLPQGLVLGLLHLSPSSGGFIFNQHGYCVISPHLAHTPSAVSQGSQCSACYFLGLLPAWRVSAQPVANSVSWGCCQR